MTWFVVITVLSVPVMGLYRGTLDLRRRTWIDWRWDVGCAAVSFAVMLLLWGGR